MKIKLSTLLNVVLATFLLTALIYDVAVSRGDDWEPLLPYDPWVDWNDDGCIDIYDKVAVGARFGSEGTPINKAALLLELQDRVDSLNASLLDLEAYLETKIVELNASLVYLQSRVETLESQMLPQGFMREPAYDSGWVHIEPGHDRCFNHNLNATNVLVYLIGNDPGSSPYIHQWDYGGELTAGKYYGAYWYDLTETSIYVHRHGQDENWDYVRIMLWKIQEPPT